MECDICSSQSSGEPAFCCPACVRAALYPVRIEHAKTLLSKERLGRQVQAIVTASDLKSDAMDTAIVGSVEVHEGIKQFQHEQALADIAESRERIERIVRQSYVLKERIEQYKRSVSEKKVVINNKRSDVSSATSKLSAHRVDSVTPLKKAIRKVTHRYELLYNHTISARVYLCAEAAQLAGLRRWRHTSASDGVTESYSISGTPALDLRDLNNFTASEITAGLTNISRLLFLSCFYLGIRLPAELILPGEHRSFVHISQPASSYLYINLPTDPINTTAATYTATSEPPLPNAAKPPAPLSRPRPLFINQKLVLLAREDPVQYALFLEGVSLLAWNIAWLCRTQGLPIAPDDWDAVCAMGRNLWQLLVSVPSQQQQQQERPPRDRERRNTPHKEAATAAAAVTERALPDGVTQENQKLRGPGPGLGVLAHGTSHMFLGSTASAASSTAMASAGAWRFASPVRVTDKLKAVLLAEMSGLEWEMLEEGDGDGDGEGAQGQCRLEEAPIILGPRKGASGSGAKGVPVVGNGEEAGHLRDGEGEAEGNVGEGRMRGTSGWTKLKSRALS